MHVFVGLTVCFGLPVCVCLTVFVGLAMCVGLPEFVVQTEFLSVVYLLCTPSWTGFRWCRQVPEVSRYCRPSFCSFDDIQLKWAVTDGIYGIL